MDREVTLALASYDRHMPFFDETIGLPDRRLRALEVGQSVAGRWGTGRHERMLRDREFDAAEVGLAPFLRLTAGGQSAFTGIPVFPRRLFSTSQIWTQPGSGLTSPAELRGRRVGISRFDNSLAALARADLQRDHGVDWRDVEWITAQAESMPVTLPSNVRRSPVPGVRGLLALLRQRELDAVILPHPPQEMVADRQSFAPLVPRPAAESMETGYFQRHGYFPIMHLIVVRSDVLAADPEMLGALFQAFEHAWSVCERRWDDPNWSWLAWGRAAFERQRDAMAGAWRNGVAANRTNIEWFAEQLHDQGLAPRRVTVEELFPPSLLDT